MTTRPAHYWTGSGWATSESVTLPPGIKLREVAAFAADRGVPEDAQFEILTESGELSIALCWYKPEEKEEDGRG